VPRGVKQLTESLRASEARYRSVVEAMAEGVLIIGKDGRILECNLSAERILERRAEEILGRRGTVVSRTAIKEDGRRHPVAECPVIVALRGHSSADVVMGIMARGERRWISVNARPIWDADGTHVSTVVVSFHDISDKKRAEAMLREHQAHLRFMANHDALTGLPTRALLHERGEHAVAVSQRSGCLLALLFIDLDRFKNVNDSLGHVAGDQLLREVATRLSGCLREVDTIARQGGDEFVALLEDVQKPYEVEQVTARMQEVLAEPLAIEGQDVFVTSSIGVALYPRDGEAMSTLIRKADLAMYRAKELGRNTVQFYTPDLDTYTKARLSLESRLKRALEREEFVLHYQPKVNLRSGRLCGAEALIRWDRSEDELVLPAEFIALAEDTGLIVPLGQWVLRRACQQNKAWQQQGMSPMPVSVNLSARQFQDPKLVSMIVAALSDTGLDPPWLELEITESVAMSNLDRSARMLESLRAMGLGLCIDDFGVGYSSLAYLRRFPIQALKIDRSFIMNLPQDEDAAAIVRAVIALAENLRLRTVAEGVEHRSQLDFLRQLNCTEAQGYAIFRPCSAEEFEVSARLTHTLFERPDPLRPT
jgi:diguanylate cyclase (GGDEF)-like protein/PAS domain S-box-containing protein